MRSTRPHQQSDFEHEVNNAITAPENTKMRQVSTLIVSFLFVLILAALHDRFCLSHLCVGDVW